MIMAKKTYIDSDKYTRSDYAHRDISQYMDKRKQKKHKKNVDAVAASLILQGYLDFKRMQK